MSACFHAVELYDHGTLPPKFLLHPTPKNVTHRHINFPACLHLLGLSFLSWSEWRKTFAVLAVGW